MSSKRVAKKLAEKNDNLDLIKKVVDKNRISIGEIQDLAEIDHPLFSFKYLQKNSICDCKDAAFFYEFLFRLKKLSELGWDEIRKSGRHSFGMEKIPYSQILPKDRLPDFITPEVVLSAFRATGSNLPFIGLQKGKIFYIIFIESAFGDIYRH